MPVMLAPFRSRCFIIYHQGGGRPSHISASNISWHAGLTACHFATTAGPIRAPALQCRHSISTSCLRTPVASFTLRHTEQTNSLFIHFPQRKEGGGGFLRSLIIERMHFFFSPYKTDETTMTSHLQFISRPPDRGHESVCVFGIGAVSVRVTKGRSF